MLRPKALVFYYTIQGGTEDGYLGLDSGLNLPFREGAAVNLVLITGEDRDLANTDLNFDNILARITNQNALLNTVVDADFEDADGNVTLGIDAKNNTYLADGAGGFTTAQTGNISSIQGATVEDYVNLALATNGAAWDLKQLPKGGVTADSFTEAVVGIKAEEVSQQLSIDVVASDADVEFVNLTGQGPGRKSGCDPQQS